MSSVSFGGFDKRVHLSNPNAYPGTECFRPSKVTEPFYSHQ